jgi:hypothetical protein
MNLRSRAVEMKPQSREDAKGHECMADGGIYEFAPVPSAR